MRVKRNRPKGRRGGLKRVLAHPITPVLLGLAVVLAVGAWVMREPPAPQAPAAPSSTQQGNNAAAPATGSQTVPAEGGGGGAEAPSDQPAAPPGPASSQESGSSQKPAASAAGADAIAAGRTRIDRSGGAAKTMLVTAYYSDGLKNGLSLQPVEVKVAFTTGRVSATVEQLLHPPQDLELYSNIPAGTRLLGANIKDGVVIVDLSEELAVVKGSAAVNNVIASLVYSVTAIPDVKAVQLWVNGRPAVLDGQDWSKPLTRADLDARNLYKVEPVIKYAGS